MNPFRDLIKKYLKKIKLKPVKAIVYANNHFEQGGTSLLYECWIEEEPEIYVAKILESNYPGGHNKICFKRECEMLKKIQGKSHIIPMVDILEDQECIILQKWQKTYVPCWKDRKTTKYLKVLAKKIFKQVCTTVQHLHKKGIAHMDIKAGNVLRGFDDNYYLSDLGECLQKSKKKEKWSGSHAHLPLLKST